MVDINAYVNETLIEGESHELILRYVANSHKEEFVLYELTVEWVPKTNHKMTVGWPVEETMQKLIQCHLDPDYIDMVEVDRLDLQYFFTIRRDAEKLKKSRNAFMKEVALLTSVLWIPVE